MTVPHAKDEVQSHFLPLSETLLYRKHANCYSTPNGSKEILCLRIVQTHRTNCYIKQERSVERNLLAHWCEHAQYTQRGLKGSPPFTGRQHPVTGGMRNSILTCDTTYVPAMDRHGSVVMQRRLKQTSLREQPVLYITHTEWRWLICWNVEPSMYKVHTQTRA